MLGAHAPVAKVSSYSKRTSRRNRSLAFAALLLLGLTACGGGLEDPDHRLGRLLIRSVGERYETVEPPASGPMGLAAASGATSAPASGLRRRLATTGFQGGYARVWQRSDDDFVAVLVFEFLTQRRASELVRFMDEQNGGADNAQRFTVAGIPGAVGYTLNARAPRSDQTLFCQLVWLAHDALAFEVRACTARPGSTDRVVALAKRQLRSATSSLP